MFDYPCLFSESKIIKYTFMKNLLFFFLSLSATWAFAQSPNKNDSSVVFIVEHGSTIDSMFLNEFNVEAHCRETIDFAFSKIDSVALQAASVLEFRASEYSYAAAMLINKANRLPNGSLEFIATVNKANEFITMSNILTKTAASLRKNTEK